MKRAFLIQLTIICLLASSNALAAVPDTITYSGFLTDDGSPADALADITFELYDVDTGGIPLWSESHSDVSIDGGMFTSELGITTSLGPVLDGNTHYLQLTIDGQAMLPRTPFNSVPYALKAGDADTLGGQTATEIQNGVTPPANNVTYDNSTSGLTATDMQGVIDELLARIQALETENASQQTAIDANTTNIATNTTNIATNTANIATNTTNIVTNTANIATNTTNIATNTTNIADNAADITANGLDIDDLEYLTGHMSRVDNEIYFTGANVNIRNGSGTTENTNALGNLIVGYDENAGDTKTGSHNLVIGPYHHYTSYGGLIAGRDNWVTGINATVSGGNMNHASGAYSSVSGGIGNTASGKESSVTAGVENVASGMRSSVTGGGSNEAATNRTSVSGGDNNIVNGLSGSITGGHSNLVGGNHSSITGGHLNQNTGNGSTITGGESNTIEIGLRSAVNNVISGGGGSSIQGGNANTISGGNSSTIANGQNNTISGKNTGTLSSVSNTHLFE